ncbi:MAG: hypothetical protein JW784_04225 [Candidatus Cloacimonetes bacterium]|nr:hypothetical protein [Candidatus Cloacimonadota bacterium]
MNKILILTFLLIVSALSAWQPEWIRYISLENYYDSNIQKLSSNSLDTFQAGTSPDQFRLNSSDDFLSSLRLELGVKHRYLTGHTQIAKIVIKYDHFWNNAFMDNLYLRFNLRQYFSRTVNLALNYYYYPRILVNRYRSETDGQYHDYTYAKNVYNAALFWRFIDPATVTCKFEISQLYYNKYFTEYDCLNLENEVTLHLKPCTWFQADFAYAFRLSSADGEDAYSDPGQVQVKDASYEANIFTISLAFPQLLRVKDKFCRLDGSITRDIRYYQSDVTGDTYHLGRDDHFWRVSGDLSYPLLPQIRIKILTFWESRDTESPFASVIAEKDYQRYQIGLSLDLAL